MTDRIDDGLTRRRVRHRVVVIDPDSMTIRTHHTYELVATRSARFFIRSYTWSGTGTEGTPRVSSGVDAMGHRNHRVHGPVIRQDKRSRLVLVDLGYTLTEGGSETVEMDHRFIDTGKTLDKFMSHVSYVGCEQIEISVLLPESVPTSAEHVIRRADAGGDFERVPLTGTSTNYDGLPFVEYTHTTVDPIPGRTHAIEWVI